MPVLKRDTGESKSCDGRACFGCGLPEHGKNLAFSERLSWSITIEFRSESTVSSRFAEKALAQSRRRRDAMKRKWNRGVSGLVIVLLTFAFKDVSKEQIKVASDAIAAAQAADTSGKATDQSSLNEVALQQRIRHLTDLIQTNNGSAEANFNLEQETLELEQVYGYASTGFDRVSYLLDTLPNWLDWLPHATKQLRRERDAIRKSLGELHEQVNKVVQENRVAVPNVKNHVNVQMQTLSVLIFELTRMVPWEEQVRIASKRVKQRTDSAYNLVTWISYVLILGGIILSASGQWELSKDPVKYRNQ